MGDSRSFRDAFSRGNAPARDGLGNAPDKFRKKAAASSKDAFKTAGVAASAKSGDAFAPKAKPTRLLPGKGSMVRPKPGLPPPATPAGVKLGQAATPKPASVKQPKMALGTTPIGKTEKIARPQKATASIPQKAMVKPDQGRDAKLAQNPFGRKDGRVQRQKPLVPAASAGPSPAMIRPTAKAGALQTPMPNKTQTPPRANRTTPSEPIRRETPAPVDLPTQSEDVQAETARAPLQIVANKSVLDHTGFRKFRRAARSSSLVLVSGTAADAIASPAPHDLAAPDAEAEGLTTTAVDDSDAPVTAKPVEPSVSATSAGPATEGATASTGGEGPPPAAPSKPAEPAGPATPPEAAAEKPVEVVEPIVEPPQSVPYDTASVPADQLESVARRKGRAGTAAAVETSWQEVAGSQTTEAQPAAVVLRKMETAPVAGYWGGAAAGAKSALSKRGFNQDDIFGVVFGIAVLAFMLLWFVRGRGEETPAGDLLATPQSMTGQSLAAMPPPAPAPRVDPFGDAPVNLKPTGPIPEATPAAPPAADPQIAGVAPPAATPAPAAPAPVTTSPAVAAAIPPAAIPIAERKMHAWFCTASSRMTKASRTELKGQLATFEDVFAGKELIVHGYADTRGSSELNVDLGARRAQTVADYLTARGLSVVDVQGVGELNGLDDNQNCPNQRRVDVWVKGGPAEAPSRECTPEPEAAALICG